MAITNGTFDSNLSSWTKTLSGSADVVWSSGRAELYIYSCSSSQLSQTFTIDNDYLTFDWQTPPDNPWYLDGYFPGIIGWKLIVEGITVINEGLSPQQNGSRTRLIDVSQYIGKLATIVFYTIPTNAYLTQTQYPGGCSTRPNYIYLYIDNVKLLSPTGTLNINSDPAGAKIIINGTDTGNITPSAIQLNPGAYTYSLLLSGYGLIFDTISIGAGQTINIFKTLIPSHFGIINGTFDDCVDSNCLNGWEYSGYVSIETPAPSWWPDASGNYASLLGTTTAWPPPHQPAKMWQSFIIDKCYITFDYDTSGWGGPFGYELYIDGAIFLSKNLPIATYGKELIDLKDQVGKNAQILFFSIDLYLWIDNVLSITSPFGISVDSYPTGASIFLGDNDTGKITPALIDAPSEGQYNITLKLPNLVDYVDTINVLRCVENKFYGLFEGFIKFNSSPISGICLDDIDIGKITPSVVGPYDVGSAHTYKLNLKDYIVKTGSIIIPSGKGITVDETLVHETGSVSINSDPAGAMITFDGNDAGITPTTIENLSTGYHTILLKLDGYFDYQIIFFNVVDKLTNLSVNLDPSTLFQPQSIINGTFDDIDLSMWNPSISGNGQITLENGTVHISGSDRSRMSISQTFPIIEPAITFFFQSTGLDDFRDASWQIIVDNQTVRSGVGSFPSGRLWQIDLNDFIGKNATIQFNLSANGNSYFGQYSHLWIDNVLNVPKITRKVIFDSYCQPIFDICRDNPIYICQGDAYLDSNFIGKTSLTYIIGDGFGNQSWPYYPTHSYILRKVNYKDRYTGNDDVTGSFTLYDAVSSDIYLIGIFESKIELLPEGCININSDPAGASIFIDNNDTGKVTPDTICNLSLGNHTFDLRIYNHTVYKGTFKLFPYFGDYVFVTITGSIYFTSVPSGARIYLDDQDLESNTPYLKRGIKAGNHTIKLTKPYYNDYIKDVYVIGEP